MSRIDLEEYQDYPIFLYLANRELHLAVGKHLRPEQILHAIRVFSLVSCQSIFCNISQIHVIFFDSPPAIKEITELSGIGRFVAHSDYPLFDEFRESRAEKFSHSRENHPAFFSAPSNELRNLPLLSMGAMGSTTDYIEQNLIKWLEDDPSSSLSTTLTQADAKALRESEKWIAKTLEERDQKALTFDVFEQTSGGIVVPRKEGAVRRSLTDIYIDHYLLSFQARCIWGVRGINHFEKPPLLAGLNYRFASIILMETGVDARLRAYPDYGQMQRLLAENSREIAFFRQCYAELALVVDNSFQENDAWHRLDAKITSSIHKLVTNSCLKPSRHGRSLKDHLELAGDALRHSADYLRPFNRTTPLSAMNDKSLARGKTLHFGRKNLADDTSILTQNTAVILVHGIRTHADWYSPVQRVLEQAGFKVFLTNYGWFDLFRFLLPTDYFRNRVKDKIYRQIRDAIRQEPDYQFSIIAHSFGTYVVSRILQDEFDLKIHRIIFVGSVVRYDFPFEQFSERFSGRILNEVATNDPWPAIAAKVTTGYGAGGTYGFKTPRLYDRWNNGGHSHVLTADHCEANWLPFLLSGTNSCSNAQTRVPLWIRFLTTIHIYWLLGAIALAGWLCFGPAL